MRLHCPVSSVILIDTKTQNTPVHYLGSHEAERS